MSGADLPALLRRVTECPAPFLDAVQDKSGKAGTDGIHVDAVVFDLLESRVGWPVDVPRELGPAGDRAHRELCLLGCWLLADETFAEVAAEPLLDLLLSLAQLSEVVDRRRAMEDEDRREELVRTCLDACGILPAGESEAQAADRLQLLDSCERRGLMRALRGKLARARELRRKMAEQRAREAAARAGREW